MQSVHDSTSCDYADLLDYGQRRARYYHRLYREAVPLEEFEDGAMRGISDALAGWEASRGGSDLRIHIKVKINYAVSSAVRDYRRWHHPTPSAERWLPPAECVRPSAGVDPCETVLHEAMLAWLDRMLAAHRACLSPTTRQALDDFLVDVPLDVIAARDHVPYEQARSAWRMMVATLRRHVVLEETTCDAERARWTGRTSGYARNRKAAPREVRYAAAD